MITEVVRNLILQKASYSYIMKFTRLKDGESPC